MLGRIIAQGNRGHHHPPVAENLIVCTDGFTVSVVAGGGMYCSPKPAICLCWVPGSDGEPYAIGGNASHDFPGPYLEVEVGFPSRRPEPWAEWEPFAEDSAEPTETVYGYVPVAMVRALVESHGGEAAP